MIGIVTWFLLSVFLVVLTIMPLVIFKYLKTCMVTYSEPEPIYRNFVPTKYCSSCFANVTGLGKGEPTFYCPKCGKQLVNV